MKKLDYLFLFLILLLAFLLSSRMILAGDFFYLFDQARDYLLVKDIIQTHDIILIGTHSGLGGFFHGPLWIYLLVPIHLFGHGNPLAFAYFYIFLQLLTVFAAFVSGAKLYGTKGGLLIALLITLSPVTWSTVPNTIGVNMLPLVFIGLFYFLIKFIRGNKNAFIFVAFFTGLSLQFETALPLILIPTVIIIFLTSRISTKNIKIIILSIFSFLLSVSTFILFDLRHSFLMTKAVLGAFGGGQKQKGYLEINQRVTSDLESLLNTFKSVLFNQSQILVFLFTTIITIACFLIYKNKDYKYRKEFLLLLLFPMLIFTLFIFYPYNIWPEYVLGLIIPISILFYISIYTVWNKKFGKIIVSIFFGVTFMYVLKNINSQYFHNYKQNASSGSYLNQNNVANWIYKDAGKGKFGYLVYTPEVYTHGMDYLVSLRSENYPKTMLQNTKEKITYLVLYPHLAQDEKAHEFWKKNVVRTKGKVLSKKVFRGGITVEKLSIDPKEPPADPNYYQGLLFR